MTLYLAPICLGCANFIEIVPPTDEEIIAQNEAHKRGEDYGSPVPKGRCKAFPDGIPVAIMTSECDHRKPIAGDHGIRFEPKTDENARYADLLFSIPNDGEDDG